MTDPTEPGWFPTCPATATGHDGRRLRCWLEPDHTDPHLSLDGGRRARWAATEPKR